MQQKVAWPWNWRVTTQTACNKFIWKALVGFQCSATNKRTVEVGQSCKDVHVLLWGSISTEIGLTTKLALGIFKKVIFGSVTKWSTCLWKHLGFFELSWGQTEMKMALLSTVTLKWMVWLINTVFKWHLQMATEGLSETVVVLLHGSISQQRTRIMTNSLTSIVLWKMVLAGGTRIVDVEISIKKRDRSGIPGPHQAISSSARWRYVEQLGSV